MLSSKKIDLYRDFADGVYLSEAPSPPLTPYPPPPSPALTHGIHVYCLLIHTGNGRGESLTREKVRRATVHKAGSKIST
jgi:hypothetical protein